MEGKSIWKCANVWETSDSGNLETCMSKSNRQQGDGWGVGAGLTVSVMCSDTQMAADTTQLARFSSPLKWMLCLRFAFIWLYLLPGLIHIQTNSTLLSSFSLPLFNLLLFFHISLHVSICRLHPLWSCPGVSKSFFGWDASKYAKKQEVSGMIANEYPVTMGSFFCQNSPHAK